MSLSHLSLPQKIRIGFVLALLLLMGMGGLAYRISLQTARDAAWVDHTHNVLRVLLEVRAVLQQSQQDERSALNAGRQPGQDFAAVGRQIQLGVRQLQLLTQDNPHQRVRGKQLETLIARQFPQRSSGDVSLSDAVQLDSQIDTVLDAMETEESEWLDSRSRRAEGSGKTTQDTILICGVIAVILGGLAGRVVHRGLRRAERAEEAQAQSERLLRTVVSGAPIMIFSLDRNGICTLSDGQGLADLGLTPGEVVGQSMFERYKDFPEIIGHYRRALAGESFTAELGMGVRIFETRYCPIFDHQGAVDGFIGVTGDVTARRRQEEQLRDHSVVLEFQALTLEKTTRELAAQNEALEQSRDEALAATRAKSEFLANMSHEIRTPMNGVLGMTDLLLRRPLDDKARHYARTAKNSAEALLVVINDILDFSKIEAGKMTVEETDVDLPALIGDLADLFTPRASEKNLHLTQRVAPDFPRTLRGDPARLRQVLTNLLGNAIKFTEHGGVTLEALVLEKTDTTTRVRLSVTDTGIGISPERQAQVFDSFTQADGSTSRRFGGTGLGLTICRQLAGLMGGEVGLASRPGEGSTFWLELPLGRAAVDHARADAGTDEPLPADLPLRGVRVLLAEDNPINREVAVSFLEDWGCGVDCAEDGQEALERLGEREYHLVLMDIQMPRLDGLQATEQLRAREAGTGARLPVLAMTAGATDREHAECLAAGMDGFLPKPFDPDDLLRTLRGWTAGLLKK